MPNMKKLILPHGPQPGAVMGDVVRQRRHTVGVSQERLAERCGLSRSYVARVERGAANPTIAGTYRLLIGLELQPDVLARAIHDRICQTDPWIDQAIRRGLIDF